MRFTDVLGRKIVSTSTAETVGNIDDFVVDPGSRRVVALLIKHANSGNVLHWTHLESFGTDAVTVANSATVADARPDVAALSGKDHRILGKRVLSTAGDELGTVDDVEFDEGSGTVKQLLLEHGQIAGERLRGVGAYAVVVTNE